MKPHTRQMGAGPDMTRRHFVLLSAAGAVAVLTGCATDPVTGKKQFMLMSEAGEVGADKENSPHQISADYGALQNTGLNRYITTVGDLLASKSHRPAMPYTFRGVNAVYVNAYAFPAGTIAVTRGMLVDLQSEAELGALLGHEIGHVCARHAAEQATKGIVSSVVVTGLAAFVQYQFDGYGDLTSGLGIVAAGALLARYSRADEREADALGLEYMTRVGYNPEGSVGLMDILRKLSKDKPNAIEMLFATHPMSEERYQTAVEAVRTKYAAAKNNPLNRERYMDTTASLRAIKGAIDQMQNGEKAMSAGKYDEAAACYANGLRQAPNDYAGLLMLARCRLMQKQAAEAVRLAREAQAVYPGEAQAVYISGMANLQTQAFDAAFQEFSSYEKLLPGNPNTTYFKGYAMEGAGQRQAAADNYMRYLNSVRQGEYAEHARSKLVEWGYIKKGT
ncbi:MAG: M48 family metalloprotease [Kiritimatiellae bacterium]|nr:M48 family metalloprotease [Kiritimatiellia bacterium]